MVTRGSMDQNPPIFSKKKKAITCSTKGSTSKICHLNERTLLADSRLEELEGAFASISWDIIALAEIKQSDETILQRKSGNVLMFHGSSQGQREIGFLVSNRRKKKKN